MRAFEFLIEYRRQKYQDGGTPDWYEKAVQLKTDNPRITATEIGRLVGLKGETPHKTILNWLTGAPDGHGYIVNDNPPFTSSDWDKGLGMRKYFDGAKPDWYEEAVALRKQGMTYPAISNKLSTPEKKVSVSFISNWLVKGTRTGPLGKLVNPDAPFDPRPYNKTKFSQVEKLVKKLIKAEYDDEDIIEWIKQDTPKLALAVKEKLPQLRAEMNKPTQVIDKQTSQDITGFIEEMGFAGIPDYKTMPAYKLKKASKGKHKFFLPTDAPVPAGVSALDEYNLDNKRDK